MGARSSTGHLGYILFPRQALVLEGSAWGERGRTDSVTCATISSPVPCQELPMGSQLGGPGPGHIMGPDTVSLDHRAFP